MVDSTKPKISEICVSNFNGKINTCHVYEDIIKNHSYFKHEMILKLPYM